MREYELEVLENYDIEVKSTRKIRGAFFCDTKEGTMLLRETNISEKRAPFLYLMLSRLESEEGIKTDIPVLTREGKIISSLGDGTKYMLKHWFSGRECDLKRESETLKAASELGRLHRCMNRQSEKAFREGSPFGFSAKQHPAEEMTKHNRELRRIRSYVRGRVAKNEFEAMFLKNFDRMYRLAETVTDRMRQEKFDTLYGNSIRQGHIVHGDYNYHNVLMVQDGIAVTNFEHMCFGLQVHDLYYFMRKTMEKCHWKQELGREILEAYESENDIGKSEKEYVGLFLAYPEKFWKIAGNYYHTNKAWMSEKNVEKLELSIRQEEEKYSFLEKIFSLNLQNRVV